MAGRRSAARRRLRVSMRADGCPTATVTLCRPRLRRLVPECKRNLCWRCDPLPAARRRRVAASHATAAASARLDCCTDPWGQACQIPNSVSASAPISSGSRPAVPTAAARNSGQRRGASCWAMNLPPWDPRKTPQARGPEIGLRVREWGLWAKPRAVSKPPLRKTVQYSRKQTRHQLRRSSNANGGRFARLGWLSSPGRGRRHPRRTHPRPVRSPASRHGVPGTASVLFRSVAKRLDELLHESRPGAPRKIGNEKIADVVTTPWPSSAFSSALQHAASSASISIHRIVRRYPASMGSRRSRRLIAPSRCCRCGLPHRPVHATRLGRRHSRIHRPPLSPNPHRPKTMRLEISDPGHW